MLSQEEQSRIRESIKAVSVRATSSIQKCTNAWQAIVFLKSLNSSIDAVTSEPQSLALTPECKAGCSFCCSVKVEVSDPEAIQIARHVQDLPQDEKVKLIEKLKLVAAHKANLTTSGRSDCAFLEAGLCSIYAIRPSVCRKAHSLSVKACEELAPEIPQNLNLLLQCEVIVAGANEAFQKNNLHVGKYELSSAVLAALGNVNAAEEWFRGKPLVCETGKALKSGGENTASAFHPDVA